MSRSGYTEDCEGWDLIRWRGAVASAIHGRRGQAFLKEMLATLDALPEKKLTSWELEKDGAVCAMGAVGRARGIDMTELDPEWPEQIAKTFGIATAMAKEIVFENDEAYFGITDERRFDLMRTWVVKQIHLERADGRQEGNT